jgi:TolA-binding protein
MAEEPGQENRDAPSNEDKSSRGLLIGFAIAGATLLAVILWVWVNPSDPKEKKDFIQAVGVLLAALAGLGGLYFTSQNLKQTRQGTEDQLQQARKSTEDQLQQARESQEQNQRLTEQGQITERFTRAIEQLGATDDTTSNPRLELRLGGVYALERIAWDSPKRDYSTVMEVLTAYVRENTPPPGPHKGSSGAASTSHEVTAEADEGAKQPAPPDALHPTADIQAILDVLRRAQDRVPEEYRTRLDLHEANLRGANLHDAKLQGAYLRAAYLQEANLRAADLREADLQSAILHQSDLREADLREADLRLAEEWPRFGVTNLFGADLRGADLRGAHLQGAHLQGAHLRHAELRANFFGADLRGADLQYAHLQGAYLSDAYLNEARGLSQEQIESAIGNENTTLPEGLTRPKTWSEAD